MTNVLSLDMRRAEWQEIADLVMALRAAALYNAVHVTLDVRESFRAMLGRLVDQANLGDYVALAEPAAGFMLEASGQRRVGEPMVEPVLG